MQVEKPAPSAPKVKVVEPPNVLATHKVSTVADDNISIPAPTITSLKSIRAQMAKQHGAGDSHEAMPLTIETLQAAWDEYIAILKANKNHSSVSIFRMATLEIRDEQFFYINTGNSMQQKFIEVERSNLIEFLMKYFNNRFISYQIIVKETAMDPAEDLGPQLTKKEKYQVMIEQYPNIKILRDRIRLELE